RVVRRLFERDLQSCAANRAHREQQRQFGDPIHRSIAAKVMDQGKTTGRCPLAFSLSKPLEPNCAAPLCRFAASHENVRKPDPLTSRDMMGSVSETKRRDASYRSTSSNIHRHSRFSGRRGRMAGMTSESEAEAEQRLALLDPVARICE